MNSLVENKVMVKRHHVMSLRVFLKMKKMQMKRQEILRFKNKMHQSMELMSSLKMTMVQTKRWRIL